MDNTVVLYKLINYIKSKNSHGKNDLLDKILEFQCEVVLSPYNTHQKERLLYLKDLEKEGK